MTNLDLFQNLSYSHDTQIIIKIFLYSFLPSIKMSGKSINFEDKKSTKAIFTKTKNYLR